MRKLTFAISLLAGGMTIQGQAIERAGSVTAASVSEDFRQIEVRYESTGFSAAEAGSALRIETIKLNPSNSAERNAAINVHNATVTDCIGRLRNAKSEIVDYLGPRRDLDRLEIAVRFYNRLRGICGEELPRLVKAIESADACLRVYHSTIDKRASDLTTREADSIKECKSMDLYPPKK